VQCVILAGGLGTRVAAVAPSVPKALIPVAGEPFAAHQLALLSRAGIRRVVYCIGHRGEAIRTFVDSGERWGLEVSYVEDGETLLGTGGALRHALDTRMLDPAFFVLYGDSYLPIDYRTVWEAFLASGKPALLTVFRNEGRWDTSNVLYEDGQVVLYDKQREDPRSAGMVHIDYGLSVLSREVLDRLVSPGARIDLADVYKTLSLGGQLAGHEVHQRFYEAGSPSGLQELETCLGAAASRRPSG
jgi:N-acetyl-alpha-D-muramate 1-phosphate uridylyltransferase